MMQDAKELYASYGNPSGGMVHKDVLAVRSAKQGR